MLHGFERRDMMIDLMLQTAGGNSGIVLRALKDVSITHRQRLRESNAAAPAPEKPRGILSLVKHFTGNMFVPSGTRSDLSFEEIITRINELKAAENRPENNAPALRA